MNRSRKTADLASHGNIFVDIANDRVGIGTTQPTHKVDLDGSFKLHDGSGYDNHITYTQNPPTITFPTGPLANLSKTPTLVFGDRTSGGDLKIYQDFYSLHIRHLGPSGFHIGSQASHIVISGSNGSNTVQPSIRIDPGATEGVKLYSGGTQRFETVGYGVTVLGTTETQELNVTGVSTFTGSIGAQGQIQSSYNHASQPRIHLTGISAADGYNYLLRGDNNTGSKAVHFVNGSSRTADNGANTYTIRNDNGKLHLGRNTQATVLQGSTTYIQHNTGTKIQTSSTGINVTGNVDAGTGGFLLSDGGRIRIGNAQDFELYHDGSHSIINDSAGSLLVRSNIVQISTPAGSKYFKGQSGVAELYHSDSLKFETTSSGAKVTGKLGVGVASPTSELEVQGANHTNLRVLSGNSDNIGFFQAVQSSDLRIGTSTNTPVKLFVNGVDRVHLDTSGNLNIPNDSGKIQLGASQDLQIFHDGSNSYLDDNGTGDFQFRTINGSAINLIGGSEYLARFVKDGAVELYHNNSKKFETTSSGVQVTGDITVPTSMDSTDAGGVAIQRFWSFNLANGNVYKCGHWHEGEGAVQLLISVRSITGAHSGTSTYIFQGGFRALEGTGNYDGDFHKRLMPLASGSGHGNGSDRGLSSSGGWEVWINQQTSYTYGVVLHVPSGRNNKSLQVTVTELNRGNTFTDQSSSAAYSSITTNASPLLPSSYNYLGNTYLRDNYKINLGNSNDLQIYHTPNSSFIDNNTNHLYIRSNVDGDDNGNIYLQALSGENSIICNDDGSVELYHDNSKKFETSSSGATVTGTLTATAFSGDGSNLTGITQTTINSNADNRVITGSGTANTLNAESKLTFDGTNLRVDQGNTSDGILGQAYNTYFGLKHADQTLNSEYMILSKDFDTFISATSGYTVRLRSGGNDTTNELIVGSGNDALTWRGNKVFHAGNDGSGSGLDADTVDGLHLGGTGNNGANQIVRTQANGYIFSSFINTTSGDTGTGSDCTRFYASQDAYLRYIDLGSMRSVMNVSAVSGVFSGREDQTGDSNYWVGSMGWGSQNFDTTVWDYGSCFFDVWSNPSGQPSGTSHWQGFQAMHYTNQSSRYGFRITCGAGNPAYAYIQGRWNTTTYGWHKLWNAANDGSGSGLDADTVDGLQASQFLRSDGDDTLTKGSMTTISASLNDWMIRFVNNNGTNAYVYMSHHTHGMHIRNDSSTTSTYLLDVYAANGNRFRVRGADALVTSNGNTMWHAGNDGSGSGLDADTLDGQQGSYYKDVPSGTVMVFRQNSAPTGWTKSTSHNNKAMRIVNGNVGSGGSNSFSTAFNSSRGTSGGSVSNHTITTAQMPSHTHIGKTTTHDSNSASSQGYPANNNHQSHRTSDRGRTHNMVSAAHANTGSSNSHNHGFSNPSINLNVAYLDFIICTRS